jgi:DGQHR domain-containing protein
MAKRVIPKEEMRVLFAEGLLHEQTDLSREYRRRNSKVEKKKVRHSDVEEFEGKGWTAGKKLKRDTWLERPKKHQDQLEDDFWCLLYRMGYDELNGPNFKIPYERADGSVDKKQIDVFAKDDETVLIIECKSAKSRTRKSLQKDLAETVSFKGQMVRAIKEYYGRDFKPKIVWLFVTNNIIWSEPDMDRARSNQIVVLTENEVNYYDSYIRHMGPAGRYQVLAELLHGQKIPELYGVKVPAVKGRVGGFTYYSFVTTPRVLLKISFVNHLALNHPDGRPAYQRMVTKNRLKNIAKFIDDGGYFPTNLLVNFTQKCRFDPLSNKGSAAEGKYGWLYLPQKYKSAWVIDGQHRLYGYSFADSVHWDDDIFVLAFEKMDTATEADLFITINSKQKSVPRSILVALQADLKWGSEDSKDRLGAISSALVKALNSDPTSPLFRKLVMEGLKDAGDTPLTIPETVKGLDRARLVGKVLHDQIVPGPLSGATDDRTLTRARKVIVGYFDIIRSANEERWERGKEGYFCSNPGVRAYLMLLAEVLQYLDLKRKFESHTAPEKLILEKVESMLSPLLDYVKSASDEDFAGRFSRKFGEGGVREYFYNLCELMEEKYSDFGTDDFRDYIKRKKDSRLSNAHSDVISINTRIMDLVLAKLKEVHGEEQLASGEPAYWAHGVENKNAKSKAYQKMQDDPPEKRKAMFAYLDILDLVKIIRQRNNWQHFESVFNIPKPDEKKGKTYYLEWLEDFNELRRIPAHSSSMRLYDDDQYEFLAWLNKELVPRLDAAEKNLA